VSASVNVCVCLYLSIYPSIHLSMFLYLNIHIYIYIHKYIRFRVQGSGFRAWGRCSKELVRSCALRHVEEAWMRNSGLGLRDEELSIRVEGTGTKD